MRCPHLSLFYFYGIAYLIIRFHHAKPLPEPEKKTLFILNDDYKLLNVNLKKND